MIISVYDFKKETLAQLFSCEFCEISENTFFTEHVLATSSINKLYEIYSTKVNAGEYLAISMHFHAMRSWDEIPISNTKSQ